MLLGRWVFGYLIPRLMPTDDSNYGEIKELITSIGFYLAALQIYANPHKYYFGKSPKPPLPKIRWGQRGKLLK